MSTQNRFSEPHGIEFFIGLANELPVGFNLPARPVGLNSFGSVLNDFKADSECWNELIRDLKARPEYSRIEDFKLVPACQIAYSVRTTLRSIATKQGKPTQLPIDMRPWQPDSIHIAPTGQINVASGDDLYQRFVSALNGTDSKRIRVCPACGKLFWAYRSQMTRCGKLCKGRYWRKQNPEKYPEYYAKYEAGRALKDLVESAERKERERAAEEARRAPNTSQRRARLRGNE